MLSHQYEINGSFHYIWLLEHICSLSRSCVTTSCPAYCEAIPQLSSHLSAVRNVDSQ